MSRVVNLSRRSFLRSTVLAGGGLVLGVMLGRPSRARAQAAPTPPFVPNAFLRIDPSGYITVLVNHSEMGQGAYTSCAMLVAEELEADWTKVNVESAPVDAVYNHTAYGIQMTGGSSSTWSEFERLRSAGAAARQMLVAAAAAYWGVDPSTCHAVNGEVLHAASKRRRSYAELVEKAVHQKVPAKPALKNPRDFKLIGQPLKRLDTPDKTNGKAMFGLDITVPGMLVALVARPPVLGGKMKSFDGAAASAVAGVRHVVKIDRGVAVVADEFWPAKVARDLLKIEWDEGPLAALDTAAQADEYAKLAAQPGAVARKDGDAAGALASAATRIEATYDLPYLAHATMEPMNCVADVRAASAEVWVGSQFQTGDRAAAAQEAGLRPEQVQLHTTLLGGGFGRRAVPDAHMVREAVQISRAVKAPVKVIWTREDDMRGGYYRPRAVHVVKAGVNAHGAPVAWEHQIVCQSFMAGTPFESFVVKNGVDETAVEGAKDTPYDLGNVRIDWHRAPDGVPTLWWRSVGHTHTAFVMETMMDELAHAAGKDPVEFRRGLLAKHPRFRKVLDLVAEKSGWSQPVAAGRGRGIAIHESFKSIIAHVVELSLSPDGQPRVHRVVCAIDCGPVVNPDTVRAQMESAVVYGLSAALFDGITFEKGRVKQRNFHDYPVLRMHQMPAVEVHIMPSTDTMGGVGEPGVPPVAPAVANALHALTGQRIRKLPVLTVTPKKG